MKECIIFYIHTDMSDFRACFEEHQITCTKFTAFYFFSTLRLKLSCAGKLYTQFFKIRNIHKA